MELSGFAGREVEGGGFDCFEIQPGREYCARQWQFLYRSKRTCNRCCDIDVIDVSMSLWRPEMTSSEYSTGLGIAWTNTEASMDNSGWNASPQAGRRLGMLMALEETQSPLKALPPKT